MLLVMAPFLVIIGFSAAVIFVLAMMDGVREIEFEQYDYKFGPYPYLNREQVLDMIGARIINKMRKER